jgi:hypothetical protein
VPLLACSAITNRQCHYGTQKHLLQVTEAISSRLDFFRELDSATRMLNLPGEDIVLKEDFFVLLERLEECLAFLKLHVRSFCST